MQLNENHVVLPREDFIELSATANQQTPSAGERVATTIQTGAIFGLMAAGVVASAAGVAKASDWLDERRHKRTMHLLEKQKAAATKQS